MGVSFVWSVFVEPQVDNGQSHAAAQVESVVWACDRVEQDDGH